MDQLAQQELLIPFQVATDAGIETIRYKLICSMCGGTFFEMLVGNQSIKCGNAKCPAVPLVVPQGYMTGQGMWKL
jgi:hypothetical protein